LNELKLYALTSKQVK